MAEKSKFKKVELKTDFVSTIYDPPEWYADGENDISSAFVENVDLRKWQRNHEGLCRERVVSSIFKLIAYIHSANLVQVTLSSVKYMHR